jgi:AraC-like DNA-binding protein
MNSNVSANPDFLVQWSSASARFTEDVYCLAPAPTTRLSSRMRDAVATLQSGAAHVEVSEVMWNEPTSLTFIPHRPGFSLLVASSSSVEYGYVSEIVTRSRLGGILFLLPHKKIYANFSAGRIRTVTCTFERSYAEKIVGPLADLSPSKVLDSLDVRSPLVSAIMLRLMHEALYPGPLSNTVVESFGHSLLVECAHWLAVEDAAPNSAGRLTARHFAIVEECLAGMAGESPSVADLAAACGLSERYFAKLFREQMGCSVAQYIKSAQLIKAKAFLLETDLPLKEIAHRLGFSTPANFSAAFRAATGSTPGQFRKTG